MSFQINKSARDLFKAILALETKNECKKFLRDLLTEAEIEEFANRWKVAQMLDKNIPYEIITKETGMSSTTIARISKWLTKGMGGYKLMLQRINTKQIKTIIITSLRRYDFYGLIPNYQPPWGGFFCGEQQHKNMKQQDLIIIGGGIMGLMTAYYASNFVKT